MTTLWVMGMARLPSLVRKAQQGSPASGPALNSSQSTVKFNPKFMHCLSVGSSQKRARPLSKLPHPIAVFTDISSTKERNSGSWDHWCAAQQQHLVNVQKYGNLGPVFTNSVCHQNEKYCNGRGWAADILLEI